MNQNEKDTLKELIEKAEKALKHMDEELNEIYKEVEDFGDSGRGEEDVYEEYVKEFRDITESLKQLMKA